MHDFVDQARHDNATIIIILYKTADHLPYFLDCLFAQTEVNWSVIAIDNASPDASRSIIEARADSRVRVIANATNLGFAKAANQGLRAAFAKGETFCVLMNTDTFFAPSFLHDFVAARETWDAAMITPRIMEADRPDEAWYAGGHFEHEWVFKHVNDDYHPDIPEDHRLVAFATGCCLGITRLALEQVGLFDESFFVYWEDLDLSLRMTQAGMVIHYVPNVSISHVGGAASGGQFSLAYARLYFRSYIIMLRKHFGVVYAWKSMLRILAKEFTRANRDNVAFGRAALAMLRGQVTPLRRVATLNAEQGTRPEDLK